VAKKKQDWCDKLTLRNKAEIYAAVTHILICHMPKIWAKVPKWYQKQLREVMWDCSVEAKEFTKAELKQIREYFEDFRKRCPEPKPRKKK
jgi:hypothetical protein